MHVRFAKIVIACTLAVAPRQAVVVDPFAGVREQTDRSGLPRFRGTRLERRAVEALDPSGKSHALWVTTRRVGARTLIFVRGWEATGSGFGQVGYGVYEPVGPDSVRTVWRGLAAEYSDPGRVNGRTIQRYEMWGCLRVTGDRLTYAHTALPARGRDIDTPPVPADGVYAWSGRAARFVRAAPLPRRARGTCPRPANLLPTAG